MLNKKRVNFPFKTITRFMTFQTVLQGIFYQFLKVYKIHRRHKKHKFNVHSSLIQIRITTQIFFLSYKYYKSYRTNKMKARFKRTHRMQNST